MARTDIAGLLTGMPSSRPDPMGAGISLAAVPILWEQGLTQSSSG
jgi:hypothetical protein